MILKIQPNLLINFQGRKPKYTAKQKELAMRFAGEGLTIEEIDAMTKKFPKLKNGPAYINEYNVREFVKLYAQEGLTVEQHLEAVKKQPSLFASKPETLSSNIENLYNFVSRFGITLKEVLELQNRNPIIRAMSPQTLIHNMTEIPKHYKKSGLEKEDYVKMIFSDLISSLFQYVGFFSTVILRSCCHSLNTNAPLLT